MKVFKVGKDGKCDHMLEVLGPGEHTRKFFVTDAIFKYDHCPNCNAKVTIIGGMRAVEVTP